MQTLKTADPLTIVDELTGVTIVTLTDEELLQIAGAGADMTIECSSVN